MLLTLQNQSFNEGDPLTSLRLAAFESDLDLNSARHFFWTFDFRCEMAVLGATLVKTVAGAECRRAG